MGVLKLINVSDDFDSPCSSSQNTFLIQVSQYRFCHELCDLGIQTNCKIAQGKST